MKKKQMVLFLTMATWLGVLLSGCSGLQSGTSAEEDTAEAVTLNTAAYDSTREFFASYNELFQAYWLEEKGENVQVSTTFGGSVAQAQTVKEAKETDVVALASSGDAITLQEADMLAEGWEDTFDQGSVPFTSTIVFLVRKGNEKEIYDWLDLVKDGVDVITPDPDTSGGGRWNFLAATAYAQQRENSTERSILHFLKKLYSNTLVLDSSARNAVTTFVERGQGDVLVTWENEAYLTMEEYPDDYEVVIPKVSIEASPVVAVVDAVTAERGTADEAKGYVEYLYSEEAQRLAGENYLRPSDKSIFEEFKEQFQDSASMVTIDDFGGWEQATQDYFSEDGLYEQVKKLLEDE